MLPISSPAALALINMPGSIGGSQSASGRTTPVMSMQWRILNSRSATVSQYRSSVSFLRHAEVERLADAVQWAVLAVLAAFARRRKRAVEGNLRLEFDRACFPSLRATPS